MSVYITDSDALDKMAAVEGEHWRKYQDERRSPTYGFWGFHDLYVRLASGEHEEEDWFSQDDNLEIDGNPAIYGDGGLHRYFVRRSDGRITYSLHHGRLAADKAVAAGFDIWR